jgi:hypothetical protein
MPTRFGLFVGPARPVACRALPTWYAVSGRDRRVGPTLRRGPAATIASSTGVANDATHAGGTSHDASRLVKLIEAAATTAGGLVAPME